VFCAGADLKERAAMTLSEASEFVRSLRGVFMDLQVVYCSK
jgi:methylglutaconyl-CoA hydratase